MPDLPPSTPSEPDESGQGPVEPESTGDEATAEHHYAALPPPPAPPPPPPPGAYPPPAASGGPTLPPAVVAAGRSRWLPPLATGLIGLMLGIVIGAVGLGVVAAVARHVHHGPAFRGDDRVKHLQNPRPFPGRGQPGRPITPVRPLPSPKPS